MLTDQNMAPDLCAPAGSLSGGLPQNGPGILQKPLVMKLQIN